MDELQTYETILAYSPSMICRLLCRVVVVGLMAVALSFGLSMAPPSVTQHVQTVHERISAQIPYRVHRVHDTVVGHLIALKDLLID